MSSVAQSRSPVGADCFVGEGGGSTGDERRRRGNAESPYRVSTRPSIIPIYSYSIRPRVTIALVTRKRERAVVRMLRGAIRLPRESSSSRGRRADRVTGPRNAPATPRRAARARAPRRAGVRSRRRTADGRRTPAPSRRDAPRRDIRYRHPPLRPRRLTSEVNPTSTTDLRGQPPDRRLRVDVSHWSVRH